jgi:hypothetical protein
MQEAERLELLVSRIATRALGISISRSLLAHADEVTE